MRTARARNLPRYEPQGSQPGRAADSRLRRALLAALALLLLPVAAGSGNGLSLPVRYARVELGSLTPTLISLPGAPVMQAAPASLGYFSKQGSFVFTGDEPRGFLYGFDTAAVSGAPRGMAVVVEIGTPARAQDYLSEYLAEIRAKVAALNRRDNELLGTRKNAAARPTRSEQLADAALSVSLDDLKSGALDEWVNEVLESKLDAAGMSALPNALLDQAGRRSELKRMYYAAEEAQLDLRLSKFELQLALARLPKPDFPGLISLGDDTLVRRIMREELARLGKTWNARQQELLKSIAAQQKWLERVSGAAGLSLPGVQIPSPRPSVQLDGAQGNPRLALRRSAVEARVLLDTAELEALGRLLTMLLNAQNAARDSGPGLGKALRALDLTAASYELLMPDELPGGGIVDQSAHSSAAALSALTQLALAFDSQDPGARVRFQADTEPDAAVRPGGKGIAVSGEEAAYGFLLVDLCLRAQRMRTHAADAAGDDVPDLNGLLDALLEDPSEFGAGSIDPAYFKLMRWYAQMSAAAAVGKPSG